MGPFARCHEKSETCKVTDSCFFFPDQVADLSMGDLLLHTSVTWLNPPASLGKWKKEPQLAAFGMALVCLTAA